MSWLLFFALPLGLFAIHLCMMRMSGDDTEHLHASYQVGIGLKPFADFFEHHMPLLWYVFSPVAWVSGYIARIVVFKSIQTLFVALTMFILYRRLPNGRHWGPWAFCLFFLFLSQFTEYLDFRPEFIALPFVVATTCYLIGEPTLDVRSASLFGVASAFMIFATPRVYPFILFLGVALLISPGSVRSKVVATLGGLATALALLLFFGPRDILFFVFELSKDAQPTPFGKLDYDPVLQKILWVFIPASMILQLWESDRRSLTLLLLNSVLIFMWFQEPSPYPNQSTLFPMAMNFVYVFDFLMRKVESDAARALSAGLFSMLVAVAVWKRDIYKDGFFSRASFYEARLAECEGRTFQANRTAWVLYPGFEYKVHPIFIRDYTYFGYFAFVVLEGKMGSVFKHNEGRGIRYVSDVPPCYVEPTVGAFLKSEFMKVGIEMAHTGR